MPRAIKRTLIGLLIAVGAIVVIFSIYIVYLEIQYYRIPDKAVLAVDNCSSDTVALGKTYTAATYNIGFGAYDHDFSFFMDSGVMKDGTKVTGSHSVAKSKDVVLSNTNGAISALKELDPDLILLQEVDTNSTRSYNVDQSGLFKSAFPAMDSTFASNFHSAFLCYPITEPHGIVNAGLLTMSNCKIASAERRSYYIDESFPNKFFDLDRCFSLNRLPVSNGRELVVVNSHMSAYDAGGTSRAKQLALLKAVLTEEYAKGNYVIVGGDFNHALFGTESAFPSDQMVPEWVAVLSKSDIPDGFSIVKPKNAYEVATCRSTDMPYKKGVNYTVVIDGFIVSDNIAAASENIDLDFDYSDHNPVLLTFTLKE